MLHEVTWHAWAEGACGLALLVVLVRYWRAEQKNVREGRAAVRALEQAELEGRLAAERERLRAERGGGP